MLLQHLGGRLELAYEGVISTIAMFFRFVVPFIKLATMCAFLYFKLTFSLHQLGMYYVS